MLRLWCLDNNAESSRPFSGCGLRDQEEKSQHQTSETSLVRSSSDWDEEFFMPSKDFMFVVMSMTPLFTYVFGLDGSDWSISSAHVSFPAAG